MRAKPGAEKRLVYRISGHSGDADAARVSTALGAEIAARFGAPQTVPVSIIALKADGEPAGGFNGVIHWGWLYLREFWIAPAWRGQGAGRALLEQAETLARAGGCQGLYLDTFDLGAALFYERCGFTRCGAIADFPQGHARVFLQKALGGR